MASCLQKILGVEFVAGDCTLFLNVETMLSLTQLHEVASVKTQQGIKIFPPCLAMSAF